MKIVRRALERPNILTEGPTNLATLDFKLEK